MLLRYYWLANVSECVLGETPRSLQDTSDPRHFGTGYGQNGDKPKRRQVKTATPKRRQNWHGQNGDKSKRRQTKTATGQNSGKSKRRQELCVVKLLMKRTMVIYGLCTRLNYLKRRIIDVMSPGLTSVLRSSAGSA